MTGCDMIISFITVTFIILMDTRWYSVACVGILTVKSGDSSLNFLKFLNVLMHPAMPQVLRGVKARDQENFHKPMHTHISVHNS